MNDKSNGNSLLKTRIAWLLLILTSFGLLPSRVVAGGTRSEPVDLGVGISAVTSCLDAGQIMTFAWSLTNAGPSNVTSSISVTNFLSSGLVYVSSSVPIGSYSPSSGVWTVPELAASAEVSMAITVMAATAGPQTNAIGVEVPSGYTDSNPGNNTASAVVNVNPPVSIICPTNITAFQNSPNGAVVSFNVTATGGSSGAPPVNVSPYASGSVFPFGTTTETASAIDACGDTASCTFTVTVVPAPMADLSVIKTASESQATVGDLVTFTIVASNAGPSSVSGALVPESLSPGWTFVGVANDANATFDPVNMQWTILSLPPYATEVLTLQAVAQSAGILTNEVAIIPPPGTVDPNPANNSSTLAVPATPPAAQADVAITITALTNNVYVTNPIPFNITVTNRGPSPASNIVVSDMLGTSLYVSGSPQAPAGTAWNNKTGIWTITNLDVNASITIQVSVLPLSGGTFTNTAQITASTPTDPILKNNTSSATVTFIGYAACGVASLCSPLGGPPNAGATVTLVPLSNSLNTVTVTTTTGAGGDFCITNLLAGTYSLTVTPADPASGIGTYQENVNIGPDTGPLATVSPWLIITGIITFGPNGPPYPNVSVATAGGAVKQTVTTDKTGTYTVTGLAANQYTVTPQAPAGMTCVPASANVTVGPGGAACPPTANFVLQGTLKISGRLTTCNGKIVIPYATVTLSTAAFPNLATYTVGSDGLYSFPNLPAGQYTVAVSHPTFTFNPAMQNVTLAKANVVQNFTGTADAGVIGGRVLSANRAPVPGVTVTISTVPGGGNQQVDTTGADGSFSFTKLAAGTYAINLTSSQPGMTFNPAFGGVNIGGPAASCNNYGVFFASLKAVNIVALEVVQVCQDWQNSVPLVQNKPTLVRAFLAPAGSTNTVRVSGATLLYESGNTTKTLKSRSPGVDARADYAAHRNDPAGSLAFDLPTSLAKGKVTLTLQWPNGVLTTYQDPQGQQTAVVNNSTTVTFQATPAVPINWVKVNWTFGGKTTKAPESLILTQRRRLLAGLPTISLKPDDTSRTLDWEPKINPAPSPDLDSEEIEPLRNDLQLKLKRMQWRNITKTIYHGVLTGTAITGQAGGTPATTSFADMSLGNEHKNLPTHEVGHDLGQPHDVLGAFGITFKADFQYKIGLCTEKAPVSAPDYPMDKRLTMSLAPTLGPMQLGNYRLIYGWDSSDYSYISPINGTADLMSYCSWTTPWVWPGSYTYTNMFNSVVKTFAAAPDLAPAKPLPVNQKPLPAGSGEYPSLLISGELEGVSDTLSLDPILPMVLSQPPILPTPGPYTLLLLDNQGNVLESVPFAPSLPVVEEDETTNLLYENFIFEIPQVPGVAAVQILDQTILLTNFTVPPPAPSVQFSSPLPGASLPSGAINLSWTASDPYAGVPLTYLLEYSSDGGNNWETFAMDLTNSQYSLTSDELSGTTNGYFQVTASDGYNAAVAQTGPLTVPYQPPTIEIDSPLPGDVYVYGESIILRASAWDMVDGDLTNSLYQWTDSLGGSLGTSNEISLDVSGLEPGTHVFSVSVTNSAGLEASTNVCITVDESLPVPLTAALAGNDEIQLSWPDAESTLQVWATFSLDEPSWFLVEGVPTDDCVNQTMILDVPMVEDTLYFSLAPP